MKRHLLLDEYYYTETLENGLSVIIFPRKKTYPTTISASIKFGSTNTEFILDHLTVTKIPAATAHFLEHMILHNTDCKPAKSDFIKLSGATYLDHTSFQVETYRKGNYVLNKFLDMIFYPCFSDEIMTNECKIIQQEIDEVTYYQEDCEIIQTTLSNVYNSNGFRELWGRNKQSLQSITPDLLTKCHEIFYRPSNMLITIIGDVNPKELVDSLKEYFSKNSFKCTQFKFLEPKKIDEDREQTLIIKGNNITKCGILFDIKQKNLSYDETLQSLISINLLCTILFHDNSDLSSKLIDKGVIQSNPNYCLSTTEIYEFLLIYFKSHRATKSIISEIQKAIKQSTRKISNENFILAKKICYGNFVHCFDDSNTFIEQISSLHYNGHYHIEAEDYLNLLLSISKEDMINTLDSIFSGCALYTTIVA